MNTTPIQPYTFTPNSRVIPTKGDTKKFQRLQKLTKVFRPASEIFIINILVLDVCAFWLPRVFNALTRGIEKEKAKSLPQPLNSKQPNNTLENPLKTLKQKVSRLNWSNALEETWREVASGPALFVWPTLIFWAARKLMGSSSLEIKQTHLSDLTTSFQHHLKKSNALSLQQHWSSYLQQQFSKANNSQSIKFKTNWLNNWVKQFTQALEIPKALDRKKELKALQHQFTEKVILQNRNQLSEKQFYQWNKISFSLYNQNTIHTNANELLTNLERFYQVLQDSTAHSQKTGKTLSQALDHTYKKLTILKAGLSIASIGITLSFLSRLVFWAQNNPIYPANRNQTNSIVAYRQHPFHQLAGLSK